MRLVGEHVKSEAPGAWPNGSLVRKARNEAGDAHRVGALATVIGSVGPVQADGHSAYGYFVEWQDAPGIACLVGSHSGRLELVRRGPPS